MSSKELRGSTHPERPFARMRRHSPRDSPSSTRELGPIDATMRDCRLAPECTITQCRDTERTQCERRDDDVGAADFPSAGFVDARACDTPCGTTCLGAAATGAIGAAGTGFISGEVEPEPTPVSAAATGRATLASVAVATIRAVVVSASKGEPGNADGVTGAALVAVFATDFAGRERGSAGSNARFCTIHTAASSTATPAPTPRHTFGPIGGRCGLVPHHLQAPKLSG